MKDMNKKIIDALINDGKRLIKLLERDSNINLRKYRKMKEDLYEKNRIKEV